MNMVQLPLNVSIDSESLSRSSFYKLENNVHNII